MSNKHEKKDFPLLNSKKLEKIKRKVVQIVQVVPYASPLSMLLSKSHTMMMFTNVVSLSLCGKRLLGVMIWSACMAPSMGIKFVFLWMMVLHTIS